MQREVTDADGLKWTCIKAYAGLNADVEDEDDAPLSTAPVDVVCTPDGGPQSVRLQLPGNWGKETSDEELLGKIAQERNL